MKKVYGVIFEVLLIFSFVAWILFLGYLAIGIAKAKGYIIEGGTGELPTIIYDTATGYHGFDYNTNETIEIRRMPDSSYEIYEGYDSPPYRVREFGGDIDSFEGNNW